MAARKALEEMRNCTSCGSPIAAGESFSKFTCPSCSKHEIVRCSKCKSTSNTYKCECGFEGP